METIIALENVGIVNLYKAEKAVFNVFISSKSGFINLSDANIKIGVVAIIASPNDGRAEKATNIERQINAYDAKSQFLFCAASMRATTPATHKYDANTATEKYDKELLTKVYI
ncbi:hypothetical protein [Candidatus Hydrogenosomobacter endosymbioticus]|nr:hypothetical protein [Candidatus Hydrogenosomobacter endosymbioticus]